MAFFAVRTRQRKTLQKKEDKDLSLFQDVVSTQEAGLFWLRKKWLECIRFVHGLQHAFYSAEHSRMMGFPYRGSNIVRLVYNFTLPIIEAQKALIISARPERSAAPLGDDETAVNAAQFATSLIEWMLQNHHTEEMTMDLSAWLAETGNAFVEVGWDPEGGKLTEMAGFKPFREGEPILRVVSPFQMGFHPQAATFRESPYCTRETLESPEWAAAFLGSRARDDIAEFQISSEGSQFYGDALLSPSLSFGDQGDSLPQNRRYWRKFEMWHVPSDEYPEGRYLLYAGSNRPEKRLLAEENAYGRLPFVHFRLFDVPGHPWGRSLVPDIMDPQREANRRRNQITSIANRVANAREYVPQSIHQELLNNLPGSQAPIPDSLFVQGALPRYATPPMLDQSTVESYNSALEAMNIIAAPLGPGADDQASKTTSGIQLSFLEEIRQRRVAPMVRRQELSWDAVTELYLHNWARFQIMPKEITPYEKNGAWRADEFRKAMLAGRVAVKIVPYSSLPVSRTATFAEWIEMTKSGIMQPQFNPAEKRMFLEDIGRGHMARTYRSMTGHVEKARRNITLIRNQDYEDIWPDFMDDADAHLSVYQEWMVTDEYREWKKRDQQGDTILRTLVRLFAQIKANHLAQLQASAMMGAGESGGLPYQQGGHGPEGVAPAGMSRPKTPSGGREPMATQGMGTAPNPMNAQGRPSAEAGMYGD